MSTLINEQGTIFISMFGLIVWFNVVGGGGSDCEAVGEIRLHHSIKMLAYK